jgi:hypothetical protein
MDTQVTLTAREILGVATLAVSVVLNIFQFYRARLYKNTLYNGLVGAFNSIGWILARCMNRTEELRYRLRRLRGEERPWWITREFRFFSVETEFKLRQLHEQLVSIAKTLRTRDQRWQAGEFGLSPEQLQGLRTPPPEQEEPAEVPSTEQRGGAES